MAAKGRGSTYWRKMFWIPWTGSFANISMLGDLGIYNRLSTVCLQRIPRFRTRCSPNSNLEKLMVTGKRSRKRSPVRWTDQILQTSGTCSGLSMQRRPARSRRALFTKQFVTIHSNDQFRV